ncbi:Hint domain-containing protein [Alphaproteobacteria bacterium KMM 3653]|uniref:Hint domain-containing protein n=1 Tax=Harenicola maris TaxID=2841044 RepID=A0AAP2G7I1_9RHOB|nr:Hint domain-containing protein [Harenicola maris]
MATLYVLDQSEATFSGGLLTTTNNGADWVNETLTLTSTSFEALEITDDDDGNFTEGDATQSVSETQTIGTTTYTAGQDVESAFHFTVTDGTNTWTLVAVNTGGETAGGASTVEGFAVVDEGNGYPPAGVPLTILTASDGAPAASAYSDFVQGDGVVMGGDGDETIDGSYTDGDGSAVSDGDDVVYAGAGNDTVTAGAGDDVVQGGSGDDTLSGGDGSDTLQGDNAPIAATDEVLSFNEQGVGTSLTDQSFTQTTGLTNVTVTVEDLGNLNLAQVHTSTQYVDTAAGETFDPTSSLVLSGAGNGGAGVSQTADVIFDFDPVAGSGTMDEVEDVSFRINDIDDVSWDDRVSVTAYDADGNEVPVTITLAGDETILADGTIDGAGNDTSASAGGSALIEVAGPVAQIVVNYANAGTGGQALWITDVHFTTIPDNGQGDDVLDGGSGDDFLYGMGGDDSLTGGAGDDEMEGGAGDDTFVMGDNFGNDTITGGETGETNGDTLDASSATNDQVLDLSAVSASDPESGTLTDGADVATFTEIENFQMGSGDDTIIGSDADDVVDGGEGADTFIGGAGDDTFGLGQDSDGTPDGDADVVVLEDGFGNDTITDIDAPIDNGDGTFTGVDTLDVSGLNDADGNPVHVSDVAVSDDGSGNALLTFPNGETLTLEGISPTDADNFAYLNALGIPGDGIVSGTAAGEVIDGSYTGDPHGDIVDNNDALIAGEVGDDDIIEAGGGDDTILPGAGDDEVDAGTGSDTVLISEGDGTDAIVGGEDTDGADRDTLSLDGNGASVTYSGTESGTYAFGGSGDGKFDEIEVLSTTDSADRVDASAATGDTEVLLNDGDDRFVGGSGSDTVDGGAGDDTIDAGAGSDTITGGSGSDTIVTGAGADRVDGGADDDTITFGGGDRVEGGSGDDVFIYDATDPTSGTATVTGGEAGEDLSDPTNGGAGDVLDMTGVSEDTVLSMSGDEAGTVTGASTDVVFSEIEQVNLGSGDDVVTGSGSDDSIDLGEGADTVTAGAGDDVIGLGQDSDGTPDGDADVVVLEDGFGNDIITDIDAPIDNGDGTFTGVDTLDVSGLNDADGNPVHVSDVAVSDDGSGNALLTFPNGETLTLEGISPTDADNFAYLNALGIPGDGIVSGTAGGDIIDASYTGDPDGDMVDNADALLAGETGEDDIILAGAGDDTVTAGAGNDEVFGADGDDTLYGGAGDDVLDGDDATAGDDTIFGEAGNDTLIGDGGSDVLDGGADDDTIYAGGDDDTIIGGSGDDDMFGESGDDVFVLGDGFGNDTIVGGETGEDFSDPTNGAEGDVVDASGMTADSTLTLSAPETGTLTSGTDSASFSEIEGFELGSGDDGATGSTGDDRIDLGEGADTVDAGAGDDTIGLGQDSDGTPDGDADVVVFSDGDGQDTILDFDAPIDNGDGTYTGIDTLDVSNLTDADGNPVDYHDVTVTANGFGDAVLNFPNGETITLAGVAPEQVNSGPELNAIGIPCFTPGTMVATVDGPRAVETLSPGDLVMTRDNGVQPVRWAGQRYLNDRQLAANPKLQPVRIKAGSLGNDLPLRDLLVSPQHKMLLADVRAEMLFGEHEVLVAATHLTDLPGVERAPSESVTYVHIMFDSHEIIMAEGAWTESYQPGPHVLGNMEDAQREELFQIFPELRDDPCGMEAARLTLKAREASVLLH